MQCKCTMPWHKMAASCSAWPSVGERSLWAATLPTSGSSTGPREESTTSRTTRTTMGQPRQSSSKIASCSPHRLTSTQGAAQSTAGFVFQPVRTLPGGAYVGTLKCGGKATAVTLASDLVDDSTLRIVVGGTRLEVFDWAPFQNSGDNPVLYLETLAECAQGDASDGNESNKSHSPSEMQLKPYQDSSTAEAPGNWCSIM